MCVMRWGWEGTQHVRKRKIEQYKKGLTPMLKSLPQGTRSEIYNKSLAGH